MGELECILRIASAQCGGNRSSPRWMSVYLLGKIFPINSNYPCVVFVIEMNGYLDESMLDLGLMDGLRVGAGMFLLFYD